MGRFRDGVIRRCLCECRPRELSRERAGQHLIIGHRAFEAVVRFFLLFFSPFLFSLTRPTKERRAEERREEGRVFHNGGPELTRVVAKGHGGTSCQLNGLPFSRLIPPFMARVAFRAVFLL